MKRLSFGQEPEVDSAIIAQEVMLLLAKSGVVVGAGVPARPQTSFECRTCKRRFPSFQALGGHRTSHKRPRGGGAAAAGEANALASAPAPARRHGCTVCGVEFALGQALGGHMRRHRTAGAEADEEESARGAPIERKPEEARRLLGLDLNATPSEDSTGLGPLVLNHGPVDCLQ